MHDCVRQEDRGWQSPRDLQRLENSIVEPQPIAYWRSLSMEAFHRSIDATSEQGLGMLNS